MKHHLFFIFCFVLIVFRLLADDGNNAPINMQHQTHDDHSEYYPPADMPEVYIDFEDMEIIIVGDGFADYYDVDIVSMVSMQSVIYTQIGGYGDSIDISSLPDAYYRIVIQSSNNNVYEGYFLWEQE